MRTWTGDTENLLKEKYPVLTNSRLAELLPGKTISSLRSKARKLGLKKEIGFRFTPDRLEELKRDYHNTDSADLAEHFGCPLRSVYNARRRLGLKKDKEFIRETGRKNAEHPDAKRHRFKKGIIPFSKGKKQEEYMSREGIERSKPTRFKKGQKSRNKKPVGYERVNIYGYVEIKISEPNIFKLKHRLLWEQAYGTIPAGHIIRLKDGNPRNCTLDNLYMISRSKHLKDENSFYVRYPKEVRELIQLNGVLKRQINKVEKNGCD